MKISKKNSLEKKLFSNIKYNMNNNYSPLDEGINNSSPVLVSTSSDPIARKHKKQETTHFKNYKQETKSNKKEEKRERDTMKIKIATLADKLYRRNKITKSLYNKMYNISIGATRLPTLITTYKSLKDFKHSDTTVMKSNFNQAINKRKKIRRLSIQFILNMNNMKI